MQSQPRDRAGSRAAPDRRDRRARSGLEPDEIEPYGRYKAKIDLSMLDRLADAPGRASSICVTGDHADEGRRGQDDDRRSSLTAGPRQDRPAARCSACASRRSARSSGSRAARPAAATPRSCRWRTSTSTSPATSTRSAPRTTCSRRCSTRSILHGNPLGIDPLRGRPGGARRHERPRAARRSSLGLGGRANGYPREIGLRHHRRLAR